MLLQEYLAKVSNECTPDDTSCSSAQCIAACAIIVLHVAAAAAIHWKNVYNAITTHKLI